MKLNFKKLAELEQTHEKDSISSNALQHMVDTVLNYKTNQSEITNDGAYMLAISTLTDLDIISIKTANDIKKEHGKLNS